MRRNTFAVLSVLCAFLLVPAAASAAWTEQSTPVSEEGVGGTLLDVSCEPETTSGCTAVGSLDAVESELPAALRWNGREWSAQAPLLPGGALDGQFDGVACRLPTSCIAVGYADADAMAQRWNGSTWSQQAAARPAGATVTRLRAISCTATIACTAVGESDAEGSNTAAIAERWDGSTWSMQSVPLPSGSTSSVFNGVMCRSSVFCVAVGEYVERGGDTVALAATWNGTEWRLTSIANPTTDESYLEEVSCVEANTCKAVGSYEESRGVYKTLIENWNGREWVQLTSPNPGGSGGAFLKDISCTNGDPCVAVGHWVESGNQVNLAMNWNGREWVLETTPDSEAETNWLWGVSCRVESCLAVGWEIYATEPTQIYPQSMIR